MIKTKEDLKRYLEIEKPFYVSDNKIQRLRSFLMCDIKVELWKYVKALRKCEYYSSQRHRSPFYYLPYYWYLRRRSVLGLKLGIEINGYVFAEGLVIYHPQGIVVNGDARVGKNCILHGANVIGNMGEGTNPPVLGDNVRLGAGAKVLGEVNIVDNVQIGAGALVIHSCEEEGALLVGVPAQVKCRKNG